MPFRKILNGNNEAEKKALFNFTVRDSNEKILLKYNLWMRYFFPKYFTSLDAPFHREIDLYNIQAYKGEIDSFTDIAFRGGAKTARTKLFVAFSIANDIEHFRRYFKILAADINNSKQISTDVYNMFVNYRVMAMYPEIFAKTAAKRQETMGIFTTSHSIPVKVLADTVGTDQRGALQEDARPDFQWFEDFENRKTLKSAVTTKAIWDNMEEARTGEAKGGACIYTCNYISEMGNVHKLVQKVGKRRPVLIVPILDKHGQPTWERYSKEDIEQMKEDDDDFEGERMCKPSASKDIFFDRERLDKMEARQPIRESAGFKIFYKYDPGHRYGSGHDVAGGVGLDSSTSVFIDFDVFPARVVGTFKDNEISPESFGDEVYRESDLFGGCIAGIENNKYDSAILKAKLLGTNLYENQGKATKKRLSPTTEYGWNTNSVTKSTMLFALQKAVEKGHLELSDPDLIAELRSYTRNDLMDKEEDPRLSTRHFDLLMACAIAWQMKDFATVAEEEEEYDDEEENENLYDEIGV